MSLVACISFIFFSLTVIVELPSEDEAHEYIRTTLIIIATIVGALITALATIYGTWRCKKAYDEKNNNTTAPGNNTQVKHNAGANQDQEGNTAAAETAA